MTQQFSMGTFNVQSLFLKTVKLEARYESVYSIATSTSQRPKQKAGKHLVELCLDALLAPSDHEFNDVREMLLNREIDVNEPFGGVRKCRKQSQYSRRHQATGRSSRLALER